MRKTIRLAGKRPLEGMFILVVEDDSDAREMIKFVLEGNGANVLVTDSMRAALEEYEKCRPDALISDIGMPEYNGYALIAKVRKLDRQTEVHTAAIAITGFVTSTDRDTALLSGFDAYMAKPFNPERLVKSIALLATARSRAARNSSRCASHAGSL